MRWYGFFILLLICSCASVGNPTGGDYDITPPAVVKTSPAPDATNYLRPKIELFFNEYISIEKPAEKVIITPPQKKQPVIRAIGKKISVELKDTLIENTTYTFDFTNGIVDNNEKNPIDGYAFAFSTGAVVDTLMVSGVLLDATNLEPLPNIMVGLHNNLSDTAFTTIPFLRTSMTNDRGQFKIRNVAPGTYRLFALKDANKNFFYDPPAEEIAFLDSLITPTFEPAVRWDTTWVDSLTVDTIKEVHYTRFMPDNLVLRLFQKKFDNQYLTRAERPADRQLVFHFNSDAAMPPRIRLIEPQDAEPSDSTAAASTPPPDISAPPDSDLFVAELSPSRQDYTLWIRDSLVYQRDTLWAEAQYMMTDTLFNLVEKTDTIRLVWKKPKPQPEPKRNRKSKKSDLPPPVNFLRLQTSAKQGMDVFDTVKVTFPEPAMPFDSHALRIQQKIDTLWHDRNIPIVRDTLNPRIYYFDHIWDYGEEYRLIADSAALFSIYGQWNDSIRTMFGFKKEEEYANIYIKIVGDTVSGFGELLDRSDKPVRTAPLIDGELAFENITPGTYYLRFTEDHNGNGRWDPGDYGELRQPDCVYYYSKRFDPKKYMDINETWDISATPADKQKPIDITKNKPVERKKRTARDNERKTGRTSTGSSGLSGSGGSLMQNRF
jgi:uncharacterized protein (DUF2141 family)